jgi:hypothetical protein
MLLDLKRLIVVHPLSHAERCHLEGGWRSKTVFTLRCGQILLVSRQQSPLAQLAKHLTDLHRLWKFRTGIVRLQKSCSASPAWDRGASRQGGSSPRRCTIHPTGAGAVGGDGAQLVAATELSACGIRHAVGANHARAHRAGEPRTYSQSW